ncbi:response regulator [Rhizorhabdus argentea]|uniref:response regulator n=1 Tax=Rhizorhabdus argentea TaxID=1387174 RepID=UPI0030EEF172
MDVDYLHASDLEDVVHSERGHLIGPAGSLDEGLEIVRRAVRIDCAILDIDLRGQLVYPLVESLQRRSTPIIFVSGYDRSAIPARFADIPLCQKPIKVQELREFWDACFSNLRPCC